MTRTSKTNILFGVLVCVATLHAGEGFVPLFNCKDLDGWKVDTPSVWQVRDGMIIGKSPGLSYNEFLRTTKHYSDFILQAKIRIINGKGNSGIQFRSKPVPKSHEVSGYQADAFPGLWGSLYDESRRNKTLASPPPEFLTKVDLSGWHSYVIHARGKHIRLELDGTTTVDYQEQDPGIESTGLIALQVHASREPIEVWFKDLMIKVLAMKSLD